MCLHTLLTQSQSRERALCTPYAVTSLSAAYAVCKTKGGLGGSPKKRRVNVETSAPRSFLKNRYHDVVEGQRRERPMWILGRGSRLWSKGKDDEKPQSVISNQ